MYQLAYSKTLIFPEHKVTKCALQRKTKMKVSAVTVPHSICTLL